MYVIYNETAHLFIGCQEGHWLTTRSHHAAKHFNTKGQAKNVIEQYGGMIQGEWTVYSSDHQFVEQDENTSSITDLAKRVQELSDLCEIETKAAVSRVALSDKELSDVYHYIEFSNFNAAQGYNACRMLQDVLRKRRDAKNNAAAITSLNEIIKNAQKTVNAKPKQKVYSPRVRMDLFQK